MNESKEYIELCEFVGSGYGKICERENKDECGHFRPNGIKRENCIDCPYLSEEIFPPLAAEKAWKLEEIMVNKFGHYPVCSIGEKRFLDIINSIPQIDFSDEEKKQIKEVLES